MSATPIRRRLTAPLFGVLLSVSLLAGCSGSQRDPSSYTAKVKTYFLEGCQTTIEADVKAGAQAVPDPKGFCTCAYAAITDKQTGIKFSEFKQANTDLIEKPGTLPAPFAKAYAGCTKAG